MAPVRGGVKDHVLRPPLDAAFEHRLERFVRGVVGVEGKIVAEHDKVLSRLAKERHQFRQRLDVLAVNLDKA